jgi:HAD superfamily hydrolase (TIGR01509 family)
MIKHVIFDLGNVLVDIHPREVLQQFSEICSIDYQKLKTFFLSPLHIDFMAGKYSPEIFYQKMISEFPCNLTQKEFIAMWIKVIGNPKPGVSNLIHRVKNRCQLSVCSNTDYWHWQVSLEKAPFLKKFNHYFLSFEMKLIKPHPQIFEQMLVRLNTTGKECIFIDDTEENILQANDFGINGCCTSQVEEMEAFLGRLNVL